jgi:hypothetical protein
MACWSNLLGSYSRVYRAKPNLQTRPSTAWRNQLFGVVCTPSRHVEAPSSSLAVGGVQRRLPRGPRPLALPLTDRQRAILEDLVHSRRRPHAEVQRATIIFQRADGARTRHLAEALRVSDPTVRLWRLRWAHATPQLAAAEAAAEEETWRGLLQPV